MGYTKDLWNRRIGQRSDLSSQVVHLTRSAELEGAKRGPVDIVFQILKERSIRPSNTATGFICGDIPATCFQDAPVYSICQNIHAEEQYRGTVEGAKVRYVGVGLMFGKPYVFERGGRPVIYERLERAKALLPNDEWWRIVSLDLLDEENFIDWTHEREWRLPGRFDFDIEEATVVLPNKYGYDRFLKLCREYDEEDILQSIKGVVNLGSVFY